MGNKIAKDGGALTTITAGNHTKEQKWDTCKYLDSNGNCVGGWYTEYYSTQISGHVNGNSSNVYVESGKAVTVGASTTENDSPVGDNGHTSATGQVTEGNLSNVYVNNTLSAVVNSEVQTHASSFKTDIKTGATNVYVGTEGESLPDGDYSNQTPEPIPVPDPIEVGDGTGVFVETRSWRDNWGWRTESSGSTPEDAYYVYQSSWTELDGADVGTNWGNHKGCILFPSQVRAEALGKNVKSIELYLKRNDSQGYAHEIKLDVWTHKLTRLSPEPNTGLPMNEPPLYNQYTNRVGQDGTGWQRSEEKWMTLPPAYNDLLSNGDMTGVAFHIPSGIETRYLHFNRNVRVRVTFE